VCQSERGITAQIDGDCDALVRHAEAFEQRGDGRLIGDLHSFVVDAHYHAALPQQPAHDPSVTWEATDGDVPADNVNDEIV
jgi:hypothetical protein